MWQCSRGIEGTADMHLRAVFSDDLNKWMPKDGIELNVKKDKKNAKKESAQSVILMLSLQRERNLHNSSQSHQR